MSWERKKEKGLVAASQESCHTHRWANIRLWEYNQNRRLGLLLHQLPHSSQHRLAVLSPAHHFVLGVRYPGAIFRLWQRKAERPVMPQLSGNERSCCHHCLKPSAPATSGFGIPPRDDNICFSDCIQHLPETELCKTHDKENFSRTLRI